VELLTKLLAYNPDDRLSARQALRHIYFKELREKDKLQQAFHNANCSHSVRPSPRVLPHENAKQQDTFKVSVSERVPATNQVQSNSSSPQSMASVMQLPAANYASSTSKSAKEDERDVFREGNSTPVSNFADTHSPGTYLSVGSAISNYVAPKMGPTHRENPPEMEAGMEFGHALPPIKSNSYNISMLSPKLPGANTNFKSSQRLQTPKAHSQKSTKSMKGTKSHRALPELSPKSAVSAYKPGEPPPYKKRANNSKYLSPYSQRYKSSHLS
jgi:serine/threonine protein kinase